MHVLFLLGSYLPHASANGVCVEKVASALTAQGHDVSCLAISRYDDPDYSEINGVKVYRIKNLWHNRVCDWCDLHPSFRYVRIVRQIALWTWRIRRLIAFPLWPLSAPLFAWRFYRKAEQICMKEKIDCVVGVYQPFESLIAITLLKRAFPKLKTTAYFCDCLSGGVSPKIFPRVFSDRQLMRWEKYFFKDVDVIYILKSHESYYRSLLKDSNDIKKINIVDIPFVTKNAVNDCAIDYVSQSISIQCVYAGSIDFPLTDPRYMIKVLEQIGQKYIKVDVYGRNNCNEFFHAPTNEVAHVIHIHQPLAHSDILQILANADVLINIGSNNPRQIPSKIFEYMSLGKPIISFYSYDEEPSLSYLRQYPLTLLIQEDWGKVEDNAAKIKEFIRESAGQCVPFETVRSLFPSNTPEYTAKKLVELCGEGWRDE